MGGGRNPSSPFAVSRFFLLHVEFPSDHSWNFYSILSLCRRRATKKKGGEGWKKRKNGGKHVTYDIPWPQESLKSDFFSLFVSSFFAKDSRRNVSMQIARIIRQNQISSRNLLIFIFWLEEKTRVHRFFLLCLDDSRPLPGITVLLSLCSYHP